MELEETYFDDEVFCLKCFQYWIRKRRQATITVTDLANQIEEEEKRVRKNTKFKG